MIKNWSWGRPGNEAKPGICESNLSPTLTYLKHIIIVCQLIFHVENHRITGYYNFPSSKMIRSTRCCRYSFKTILSPAICETDEPIFELSVVTGLRYWLSRVLLSKYRCVQCVLVLWTSAPVIISSRKTQCWNWVWEFGECNSEALPWSLWKVISPQLQHINITVFGPRYWLLKVSHYKYCRVCSVILPC